MRSVERALAIFDCFSADRPTLGLRDIAARLKLAKSTTFRFVQALEERGYLVRLENNEYSLSFKVVRLAGLVQSTVDVRRMGRGLMERIASSTGESVTLSTAVGVNRVCIDVVNTPAPLMTLTKVGEHNPMGTGATSLALMAHLPDAELRKVMPGALKRSSYTRRALLDELAATRDRGYAVSHGGRVAGLSGIAAPVWNAEGRALFCLSIVLPTARVGERLDRLIQTAVHAGRQLSSRLGAPETVIAKEVHGNS
jgi:DNA-binding IclR family transcriptional regulator